MRKLPPYLVDVLRSISTNQGEDIDFALGCNPNGSSYVSRLKRMGLAYTVRFNGKTEVWLTDRGFTVLAEMKNGQEKEE